MSNQRGNSDFGASFIVAVIVIALAIMWQACGYLIPEEKIISGISKRGYSEITVKSKHVFFVGCRGCGGSDSAYFDIEAINPKGDRVDLIACAGWPFKGVTIRTD